MACYKLHYFNARGRAEQTRLLFVVAGVEYEDIRITDEEWPALKQGGLSPMGYLPVLEVDGKKLCESMTISKYIARELGLSPLDSFEVAQCDQICDAYGYLLEKMLNFLYFEKDEERKEAAQEKFLSNRLPTFLTNMTALLKSNNDGKGFFVGNKLSYADLVIFNGLEMPLIKSSVDKFPELKAHHGRIGDIPAIKKWIKKRPVTVM